MNLSADLKNNKFYSIIDRSLFLSLLSFIFFIPISKAGVEIGFGFSLIFYVLKKIQTRDFSVFKFLPFIFLATFFIFSTLSLINSGLYLSKSLKALICKWGEHAIVFLMIYDEFRNSEKRNWVFRIFVIGSVIVGLDGLIQRLIGTDPLRGKKLTTLVLTFPNGTTHYLSAVNASFYSHNTFGSYLACLLLIILSALFCTNYKQKKFFFYLSLCFLLSINLILTFSRTSLVAFFTGFLFLCISARKMKWFLLSLLLPLIVMVVFPDLRQRILFTFQSPFGGLSDRQEIWNLAWRMIKESPYLGKGIGTFMDYSSLYSQGKIVAYTHNCYLQIWAETGIFALLSFVLFLGSILVRGIKAIRKKMNPHLLGWLSAFFAFTLMSFLDTQLYSLQLSALFWTLASLVCAFSVSEPATSA